MAPLAVDVDGTLLHEETQDEMLQALATQSPELHDSAIRIRDTAGKAAFKRYVLEQSGLGPTDFRVRDDFVTWLREERLRGREIVIASGSPIAFVQELASIFDGLFFDVIATHGDVNMTGARKAEELVARFGSRGYDYAGNSQADLAVWRHARRAVPCGAPESLIVSIGEVTEIERVFA